MTTGQRAVAEKLRDSLSVSTRVHLSATPLASSFPHDEDHAGRASFPVTSVQSPWLDGEMNIFFFQNQTQRAAIKVSAFSFCPSHT